MQEIHNIGSVLIVQKDKFLLVKAKVGGAKGLWNNPGGHIDDGESWEEAAEREAFEETGYKVEVGDLVGVYKSLTTNKLVTKKVYLAEILSGGLNIPEDEIEEIKWFSVSDICDMRKDRITFGARQSVKDFVDNNLGLEYKINETP